MKGCRVFIFITIGFSMLAGCKKSTEPEDISESVPATIFPLTAGHRFEFSGYLTESSTEDKIPNSEAGFSASWTIFPSTPLADFLPVNAVSYLTQTSAPLILDSVRVTGILTEPKVTPVFAYYDTSSGDYYYLTNFGYFFRSYFIYESASSVKIRDDSLRFIKLASPKAKTMNEFIVHEENFQSYRFSSTTPAEINLKIVGQFEKKENLTLSVNGKDTIFTTYYLSVKNKATIVGLGTSESINAKFWLADGIGPVQFFLAGDDEAPGSFRKLKGKNF